MLDKILIRISNIFSNKQFFDSQLRNFIYLSPD